MSELTPQTVKAIYEDGVLRLHRPLPLNHGQEVWAVVGPQPAQALSPNEILSLAAQVYEGLSPDDIDEIERLALNRNP